jgi:hypothetical protein
MAYYTNDGKKISTGTTTHLKSSYFAEIKDQVEVEAHMRYNRGVANKQEEH